MVGSPNPTPLPVWVSGGGVDPGQGPPTPGCSGTTLPEAGAMCFGQGGGATPPMLGLPGSPQLVLYVAWQQPPGGEKMTGTVKPPI